MSNSNLHTSSLSSQAGITRWLNPPKVGLQRPNNTTTTLQNRVNFVISLLFFLIHSCWRNFLTESMGFNRIMSKILLCFRLGYISKAVWVPCSFSSYILTTAQRSCSSNDILYLERKSQDSFPFQGHSKQIYTCVKVNDALILWQYKLHIGFWFFFSNFSFLFACGKVLAILRYF